MGIISALFNLISKGIKYLLILVIVFVAIFLFGKRFSGGGAVKKASKTKGYYDVTIKNFESKEPFQINFIDDSKLTLDGVEYTYNFTETLGSYYYGYVGFEVVIKNTAGENRHIRIVRGTLNNVTEGPTYEFIKRVSVTDNAKYYKEEKVDSSTWNKGREYITSMEKDIFDSVFNSAVGHNGFSGIIW